MYAFQPIPLPNTYYIDANFHSCINIVESIGLPGYIKLWNLITFIRVPALHMSVHELDDEREIYET